MIASRFKPSPPSKANTARAIAAKPRAPMRCHAIPTPTRQNRTPAPSSAAIHLSLPATRDPARCSSLPTARRVAGASAAGIVRRASHFSSSVATLASRPKSAQPPSAIAASDICRSGKRACSAIRRIAGAASASSGRSSKARRRLPSITRAPDQALAMSIRSKPAGTPAAERRICTPSPACSASANAERVGKRLSCNTNNLSP